MRGNAESPPALSVVLPVFGNRAQLPELLERLEATLPRLAGRWEIVCVEDCGGDGSREWLLGRSRADRNLVVVENPRNLGQHESILRGLAVARGERVAVMDADLQDAPEDLARLVAAWRPGLGAVFAQPTVAYQPAARHWSGRWFKSLLRRIAGRRLPERVGTFVLIGAAARQSMLAQPAQRPFLQLLLLRTGLPLAAVGIEKGRRADSGSGYTTARRLRLALQALYEALRWRLGG